MKKLFVIGLLLLIRLPNVTGQNTGIWDVYQFGAKGDGQTPDTEAIQKAIDQCHGAGGGKVYLHNGTFLSATLFLKDHVILHIEAGATLLGMENAEDYPDIASKYPTYDAPGLTSKALIYGENLENITIEGRGTIDGRGDKIDKRSLNDPYLSPSFRYRPRIIHIRGSKDVLIRDITLLNSASWVQTYQQCINLVISGITVDSRENPDIEQAVREYATRHRNTDGLDVVDCERVRISNCQINSGDDAICLKSFSPDKKCRDIAITNCIVSAGASGIKIGTETAGAFEDITVQNCVVYDTRGEGIALMTVDGARIERILISGITLRNIKRSGIFVRAAARNRTYGNHNNVNTPALKNILIENIMGDRLSALGCSITGLETCPVENITLSNIRFTFEGGGKLKPPADIIPEKPDAYPTGSMFGTHLPAYGFFIRHVNDITFSNVHLSYARDDDRPAIVCHDVKNLCLSGLKAQGTQTTPSLIVLKNTSHAHITQSQSRTDIPCFLTIAGNKSGHISLTCNLPYNSREIVRFEDNAPENALLKTGSH